VAEVAHHWPWLAAELAIIRPALVVPVGRHALRRFTKEAKISDVHGRLLEIGDRALFPLFHPAAALRSPEVRGLLFEDARVLGQTVGALAARPEPAGAGTR
jgi:uracil-DNA glycosylase family 4